MAQRRIQPPDRAVIVEIESHQRTDEQLQKARQAAEQANQAKSRYISAISHELRTPLNSILGYAQILDADDGIPANRRQAVQVIRRSGDHCCPSSTAPLTWRASKAASSPWTSARWLSWFSSARLSAWSSCRRATRACALTTSPKASCRWGARRRKRLRQIPLNLLGNAVKFTDQRRRQPQAQLPAGNGGV